ncbi:MAG: FUSC family protein [Clostridium sp.]
MTFYEELQLSSTGSKALIKNTTDPKEKRRHILIYNFKVYLVMAFCFVFVTLFSMLFGSDNSVAGVVFLLALLVLRQADFGIRTSHGLICIAGIFTLLITGPRLANTLPAPASLLVNFISILLLMILGCHNVIMYNQSTFVLGYLLLYGYDVTGRAYLLRVLGLLVSMMVCMLVFYKNQKKRPYRRSFPDLFREFNLKICPQPVVFIPYLDRLLGYVYHAAAFLPRAMWAGIACMSVCLPFPEDSKDRTWKRGVFNILGCGIFPCVI